jgi:hypothetical protein
MDRAWSVFMWLMTLGLIWSLVGGPRVGVGVGVDMLTAPSWWKFDQGLWILWEQKRAILHKTRRDETRQIVMKRCLKKCMKSLEFRHCHTVVPAPLNFVSAT